ncbi:MAG: phosphate ABC transporter permease PstA [Candidatus Coproplasma sp.]
MMKVNKNKVKDVFARIIFFISALASIVAVFGIIGYILYGSIPAFREVGFFNFLFGSVWSPDNGEYGILYLIINSIIVTVCSVIIGGTVGVFTAIFLSYWCPSRFHIKYGGNSKFLIKLIGLINKINLSTVFDQIIKLLAGIPSIVFGLFGLEMLVPVLSSISADGIGQGIAACSILLSIMIVPTVTSLSKTAIDAVPQSYFEGALALGNTKAQAVFRAVVPAARSGIVSALILGVGRAMGEAMAVIWVAGNRVFLPNGLFSYISTLTTNIVLEMGYSTGVHRSALIGTGLVLLAFILIITLSLNLVPKEYKGKKGVMKLSSGSGQQPVYRKKGVFSLVLMIISIISASAVAIALVTLIIFILVNGFSNIDLSFFSTTQSLSMPTLWPSLLATLEIIFFTLIIALPLGIGAAIYLNEYAKPDSKIVKVIRTFIDTLSGVPSIVFGLFGNILFVKLFGGLSVLAGSFTMILVVLPTIIRSTEESLRAVPVTLREASLGLGASKIRTIIKIVLPSAFPGIATACILSIGRIIGESAALIYTMGTTLVFSGDPSAPGCSLSVLLYYCANEGLYKPQAYMLAVILLIVSLALNLTVYFIQRRVRLKNNG